MRRILIVALAVIGGLSMYLPVHADLNDGLVAYYKFNGDAKDESGNGNDGTVNGATLTTDRFGNADSAYSFDGVDDNIRIGDNFDSYQSITLSAWVSLKAALDDSGDVHGILVKRNSHSEKTYVLYWAPDPNYFTVRFYGDQNCSADDCWVGEVSNTNPALEKWYFLTAVFENGNAKLYVNGELESEANSSLSIPDTNAEFTIGSYSDDNGPLHGKVDDVRIYNRVLSGEEIQSLYYGGGRISGTDSPDCPTPGNAIDLGFDFSYTIPTLSYSPPIGTGFDIEATFKFYGDQGGKLLWELTDFEMK